MADHPETLTQTSPSFYGLGIAPQFLNALERLKFHTPTPIQHKAIPIALEGQDVIGIAQTGTGKTLAFGIPMLQQLAHIKDGRGLVLVPTRELAAQVQENLIKIDRHLKLAVIIGGASMGKQIQMLKRHPRVIVATPGRLIDHLQQQLVSLKNVKVLVLDEADRMFDMGFAPQIRIILHKIPRDRQTMLFSATMPTSIIQLASSCMKLPVHVEIAKSGTVADHMTQELFIVKSEHKRELLGKLLQQFHGSVLLFTRTKIGARKITRFLRDTGHRASEIHSNRTLSQRREALEGFRTGKYRILVATDIASRGVDVSGIELVLNYDLPDESENYVHRVGRTARAGKQGHAIAFATPDQGKDIENIEKLMRTVLPVSKHPEMPSEDFITHKPRIVASFGSRKFRRRSSRFMRRI